MLERVRDAGYSASGIKFDFFLNETIWLGHEIIEHGINPNKEKMKSVIKLKPWTS